MAKNKTALFESEKISKAMVALAIPSIMVSVVDLIYSIVDSYFVGQLNNTAMIAAISLSATLCMFIESIGVCVGIGGGSFLGRSLGAHDEKSAEETVRTSMTACFIGALVSTVIGFVILKPFIAWQTSDVEVQYYAYGYSALQNIAMLFVVIRMVTVNLIKSVGDIKYPSYIIMFSVVLNTILDPIMMFGLNMGIMGAGLATVISKGLTAIILLVRLHRGTAGIIWKPFDFHIDMPILKEILKVGTACYVRNVLPCLSSMVYNKEVFKFGTDFTAGCSVGKNAGFFMSFFISGLVNGYLPFAAYNYGSKNYQRLWEAIKWNVVVLMVYSVFADAFMLIWAEPFIGLFTTSPIAIAYGAQFLRFYAISIPMYSLYYVFTVTLQAAGKGKESMVLSISRQGLIFIPLMLVLPRVLQMTGVYLSQPMADVVTVIVAAIISRKLFTEIYQNYKNQKYGITVEVQ